MDTSFKKVFTNKDLSNIIFNHKKNLIDEDIKKIDFVKLKLHPTHRDKDIIFNSYDNIDMKKVHSIIRTTTNIRLYNIFPINIKNVINYWEIPVKRYVYHNRCYNCYFLTEEQAKETMNDLYGKKEFKDIKLFGPDRIDKYTKDEVYGACPKGRFI